MPQILFFPFYGPNRHSDRRLVECRMDFSADRENEFPHEITDIRQVLIRNGILDTREPYPVGVMGQDRIDWYCSLFAQTVLMFQRLSGHDVNYFSISSEPLKKRSISLLEHEDAETALAAIKLTAEVFSGKSDRLKPIYDQFLAGARQRALSPETRAIIGQALKRDIPFFQLERAPLSGCIDTGLRVRRNGLLSLGQGANSQILDGTFRVSRSSEKLSALLRNPAQRLALLRQLGLTVVRHDTSTARAGTLLHLLHINGKVTATMRNASGLPKRVKNLHASLTQQAHSVANNIGNVPFLISYRVSNFTRPMQPGEGIVAFDLAPDLGSLLGPDISAGSLLDIAAADVLTWLYPQAGNARIPLVAVTGTNGKTTTSRMINHIFSHRGYKTGLVCTDGIFLGGKQVSDEDNSTFMGHARVLTSRQVNAAVLETHHRGIAVHGFAFHQCDVGICLNVTEDHLAEGEIETIDEMTDIKRAVVERASKAAILFADDSNSMAMITHMSSEIVCLVSLGSGVGELEAGELGRHGNNARLDFSVLEFIDGQSWIVMYCNTRRLPVMPVNEIPATFDGAARFNVSNAMHAIAASHYSGIDISVIRSAMGGFRADQQYSPGRINEFEGLPCRVIMDFAHNQDGVQKICEFTDLQQVEGRKVIAFAGSTKRSDELNGKMAKTVAGHFDFYFCKDYEPAKPPKTRYTAPFMQSVLIEQGVSMDSTKVLTFGRDVIFEILDSCKPGDMLLFLAGHVESVTMPLYIEEYKKHLASGDRGGI